jgi:hypothetical protein
VHGKGVEPLCLSAAEPKADLESQENEAIEKPSLSRDPRSPLRLYVVDDVAAVLAKYRERIDARQPMAVQRAGAAGRGSSHSFEAGAHP